MRSQFQLAQQSAQKLARKTLALRSLGLRPLRGQRLCRQWLKVRSPAVVSTTCGVVFGLVGGLAISPAVVRLAGNQLPLAAASVGVGLKQPDLEMARLRPEDARVDAQQTEALAALPDLSVDAQSLLSEPAKKSAQANYQRALDLAQQAVFAYQRASQAQSDAARVALTQRERLLWQASLRKLAAIPQRAEVYPQAAQKQIHYRQLLANAEAKLPEETAETATNIPTDISTDFLREAIQGAGVSPEQVHITLCAIDPALGPAKACVHHQGDVPLASPASLIKLPIAIALIQKAADEQLDLKRSLTLDSGNFTENAEGAVLEVDRAYPLVEIMAEMIEKSDNIATNQLIDFIGRDALARILAADGYHATLVDHKLVGNSIVPEDAGTQANESTSDDITAMMVTLYDPSTSAELASGRAGPQALRDALKRQKDRDLGYKALENLDNLDGSVEWLGEKTGQNDRLIGSTLAMEIGNRRYALTVALDHSGDGQAVRDIIRSIAQYKLEILPLEPPLGATASPVKQALKPRAAL